jgi:hypothetical protein
MAGLVEWGSRFAQSASGVAGDLGDLDATTSTSSVSLNASPKLMPPSSIPDSIPGHISNALTNNNASRAPAAKRRRLNRDFARTRVAMPGEGRDEVSDIHSVLLESENDVGDLQDLPTVDAASYPSAPRPGSVKRRAAELDSDANETSADDVVDGNSSEEEDGDDTPEPDTIVVMGEGASGDGVDVDSVSQPPPTQANAKVMPHAVDLTPYRRFVDPQGKRTSTHGALLPKGYKMHNSLEYPWICPIRSCRQTFSELFGLGRHTTNAHRGKMLNDNGDGTLSIVGQYADRAPGNGKAGTGSAKPPLIVSQHPPSVHTGPILPPQRHVKRNERPKYEKRAGDAGLHSSILEQPVAPTPPIAPATKPVESPARVESDAVIDRPYHMWPGTSALLQTCSHQLTMSSVLDASGNLSIMPGLLLPTGYQLCATVAHRQWICPGQFGGSARDALPDGHGKLTSRSSLMSSNLHQDARPGISFSGERSRLPLRSQHS